jgi:hypothetical protein
MGTIPLAPLKVSAERLEPYAKYRMVLAERSSRRSWVVRGIVCIGIDDLLVVETAL